MNPADEGRGDGPTAFVRSPGSAPPARPGTAWELPGGLIDLGERPCEAAVRELWEESGQRPAGALRFTGYARFVLRRRSLGGVRGRARGRGGDGVTDARGHPSSMTSAMRWAVL
ncbi:NUDIX domain-containing protein [Streptomyces sp. NPDC093252]|uniref:NUDIX hydrolase n=1 Tax=Streptomyces sp. NPDC093252 TaxID=3154980 RepID=UPI0034353184